MRNNFVCLVEWRRFHENIIISVDQPGTNHNILDLIITTGHSGRGHDPGMLSDHQLVTCFLPVTKMKPRTVEYTFCDNKNMILDRSMKKSTLFTNPKTTTDSYAEQFGSVVGVVLDSVAPLRTKFKQRRPQWNCWLSPEAVKAKHRRRYL